MRNFLTNRHIRYWKNRKIDWKQAYFTPEHPHRQDIIKALSKIDWFSVIEVGCGAGANLSLIKKIWPNRQVGGIDLSEDAIIEAKKNVQSDALEVGDVKNIFLSDKSSDVVLTDACLIYQSPLTINRAIKEIKRVCRKNVIFVEFYHKNPFKRILLRLGGGYNSHPWPKLLKKHRFKDIKIEKITSWPDSLWEEWGYIITARI